MDLLGGARSPESINHTLDSSFEPHISAVSISCDAVYKEQPYLSFPLSQPRISGVFTGSSHPQGKWSCSCAKLLKGKACRGLPFLTAAAVFQQSMSCVQDAQEADSCSTLQGTGQDRALLLAVYKSSKFWVTLWLKMGKVGSCILVTLNLPDVIS